MIEKQELHCHNCNQYVQFELDLTLNGNHIITCPICGHEHCRVIENGKITDRRWDQRNSSNYASQITNGNNYYISTNLITSSVVSTYDSYSGTTATNVSSFLYQSWLTATANT